MRGLQATAPVEKATQDRRGDRVRRVGDDVEGTPGQTEIGGIGTYDGHPSPESLLEPPGTSVVELDGDDTVSGLDQGAGDGTGSRADVEDERPFGQRGLSDEASSSSVVELVPAPPWRGPTHGGGPS